jgi:hypothetical protein
MRRKHPKDTYEILKFLVIGRGINYAGPVYPTNFVMFSEKIVLPSIEALKEWEEKKIIVGGLFAGQRAGAMIKEATSGEELGIWMKRLPVWAQNTWEVIPLQSFQSGVDDIKRQIVDIKKMAEMSSKPKFESATI